MSRLRSTQALVLLAALVAAMPGWAQKQSLAERVAVLEAQSANAGQASGQANVELLNRLTQLQGEVTALRGLVEQLQNENEQAKQSSRAQYLDIDTRLQRLESGAPGRAAVPAGSGATVPPAKPAAKPATRPAAGGAGSTAAAEQAAYGSAFEFLKQGNYVESARGFKAYLDAYPQGALAPNAWYWLGESYYVTQNYPIALQSFETLLSQFPDSTKAPDALLKKGYCQIEMGEAGTGQQTLGRVINNYPGTDASRLAESRLRALSLEQR